MDVVPTVLGNDVPAIRDEVDDVLVQRWPELTPFRRGSPGRPQFGPGRPHGGPSTRPPVALSSQPCVLSRAGRSISCEDRYGFHVVAGWHLVRVIGRQGMTADIGTCLGHLQRGVCSCVLTQRVERIGDSRSPDRSPPRSGSAWMGDLENATVVHDGGAPGVHRGRAGRGAEGPATRLPPAAFAPQARFGGMLYEAPAPVIARENR